MKLAARLALCALWAGAWGSAATARDLKIATWNLDWLTDRPQGDPALPREVTPRPPDAIGLLRGYADRLDADVIAFQEVDGAAAAAHMFPPDRYQLQLSHDAVVQRVGFAVRRGIAFTANDDDTALNAGRTHALRSGVDITLQSGAAALRLLAVHLKAGCREQPLPSLIPSCVTLAQQQAALQDWISLRARDGAAFVLLGDFNRWMDHEDTFFAALSHDVALSRATQGRSNPCWGGGAFLDHIIAGGSARAWMRTDQLRVMVYHEKGPEWIGRLSDHCPVSVRFDLPD